jgi:hypothetical protein
MKEFQMPVNRKVFLPAILAASIASAFVPWTGAALRAQDATQASPSNTPNASQNKPSLVYTNKSYGFRFALPASWKGYSIVVKTWGDGKDPLILIRHPLWTEATPRQDIPVMVIKLEQWDLIQQGKLSVSAAPIGPDELGHNAKYVFALPPRYNFAYLTGYEEVADILTHHPLTAF